jgi:phosphatidylserine decarboxylase
MVAGIRLNSPAPAVSLRCGGPRTIGLRSPLVKGEEMGWFEHGSTIIAFAPRGFTLAPNAREGGRIRVGEPLMRLPG